MVRILKSIPIVVIKDGVQASSQNLSSKQDFPTPEWREGSFLKAAILSTVPESPINSN